MRTTGYEARVSSDAPLQDEATSSPKSARPPKPEEASPWTFAQAWAQRAVDRPAGALNCALRTDGTVWCWGYVPYGFLNATGLFHYVTSVPTGAVRFP